MRTERARGLDWFGLFLVGMLVAGGCASRPRIDVPPALPNVTREQFLTLRWALVRRGGTVRAVGTADSSAGSQWDAAVALESVDGGGHVASRGSSLIRPGFGPRPTAFEVELVPRGGETGFRLRVLRAQQYNRPGRSRDAVIRSTTAPR